MADLIFYCQFIQTKTGASAVAPTIDIDRFALADAATATVITGGSPSEGRNGVYYYRLASASPTLYNYIGTFKTASSSVDQQHLSALGIVIPDALVSTRLASADFPDTAGMVLS